MAREDMVVASQEELRRLHVIRKVIEGLMIEREAGEVLGVSVRQIRRLVKRVKLEGSRGVIHRSRGRVSNRAYSEELKVGVQELYREKYRGFGPTLAVEKLWKCDRVELSRETLRGWLIDSGDWRRHRKRKGYRAWRERKGHLGEMVQMDGSHHDWLEGRGAECVLMGIVDDATGRPYGRFYGYEGTVPALDSFRRYIEGHGIPQSVYLDKHTTYKSPGEPTVEEQLAGEGRRLSEFERAMKELGVEVIHAHSPQAKGRIERFFGTMQDRLVKEMRLAGIKSLEEANEFLEGFLIEYQERFGVIPARSGDLHRPVPKRLDLDGIFCLKTKRSLRNDFTVSHNGRVYQVEDRIRANKVMVQEQLDGTIRLMHKGHPLTFKELPRRPMPERKLIQKKEKRIAIPPRDHAWRNFKYGRGKYEQPFIASR